MTTHTATQHTAAHPGLSGGLPGDFPGRHSHRLLRALATLGLDPPPPPPTPSSASQPPSPATDRAASMLDALLPPAGVALITGPSGAGKSTMLRHLARRVSARRGGSCLAMHVDQRRPVLRTRPVIDLLRTPVDTSLSLLAGVGLGEGALLSRTPRELSDGQRARLRLAIALDRATRQAHRGRRVCLLVDELGTGLDTLTAASLASCLSRWVRRASSLRLIAASSHDALVETLAPDLLVWLDGRNPPRLITPETHR